MHDQNNGTVLFHSDTAYQPHHFQLMPNVQRGSRLVQEKYIRLLHQCPRQHHPLPLAPAQLIYKFFPHRSNAHILQQLFNNFFIVGRNTPLHIGPSPQTHEFIHSHGEQNASILRYIRLHPCQLARLYLPHVPPLYPYCSDAGQKKACKTFQQRCFSNAIRANQACHLACRKFRTNTAQYSL